jgi:hypothetical protein
MENLPLTLVNPSVNNSSFLVASIFRTANKIVRILWSLERRNSVEMVHQNWSTFSHPFVKHFPSSPNGIFQQLEQQNSAINIRFAESVPRNSLAIRSFSMSNSF